MIKKVILIFVNALLVFALIACLVFSYSVRNALRSQQAAPAWAGQSGERFAQISVFFPETSSFSENNVLAFRHSLNNALVQASLDTTQERKLYTDAWSASYQVSLIDSRGNLVSANAIAVGGDFFMFHPYNLRSGSYLSPNDFMHDRIVLDEELAWRLFGAIDLAGFEVMINTKPFIIAGVISRDNDFASTRAYNAAFSSPGNDPFISGPSPAAAGLFMTLEALNELTQSDISITTYEIVMPNMITGFALETIEQLIPDPSARIIENSARYSLSNTIATIRSFGERSMHTYPIMFPYWENAARLTEDWLALLLVLTFVFMLFPLICGIIYLVKLIRFGVKQGRHTLNKQIEKHDKRAYEKYLLQQSDGTDKDFNLYDVDDIIEEIKNGN